MHILWNIRNRCLSARKPAAKRLKIAHIQTFQCVVRTRILTGWRRQLVYTKITFGRFLDRLHCRFIDDQLVSLIDKVKLLPHRRRPQGKKGKFLANTIYTAVKIQPLQLSSAMAVMVESLPRCSRWHKRHCNFPSRATDLFIA